MIIEDYIELFERDLKKLSDEINAYENEELIWIVKSGISNSAGTLCLHLAGNLRHFIGATLGNTGYVRDRDGEFSIRGVKKQELLKMIADTIITVKTTLERLNDTDLAKDFPLDKHGKIESTQHMLLHLFGHFAYHLGQVNYHRRLSS